MVFHLSLSDNKSFQVSKTLLSILADLNNAVVLMVSYCPLISKFSSPFTNLLMTVPRALITIGITVTFMFHNFFISLARLVLHNSVSWWLSTEWQQVSSSQQDSSQYSGRSQQCYVLDGLVLFFPSSPVPVPIFWWRYRAHQLQLVSPSLSCAIVIFKFSGKVLVFIYLFAFFQFYPVVSQNSKVHYSAGSPFFCWLIIIIIKPQSFLVLSLLKCKSSVCAL